MAKMTINNGVFELLHTATGYGTFTDLIATQNTFVDKNISIKITVPQAGNPALNITDKGSTNITVGTVNGGYYPLTTSLTGTLSVGTAGWIDTSGLGATDDSVTVGRIIQSTLKNGTTTIASGSTVTPSPSSSQTINIGEGYNSARTVVIAPMSSGTKAAASVTISGTATTPTLVNTSSAISGKTQVNISGITTSTSEINTTYYVALTADAPATTPSVGKTVDTAGYLGPTGTTTQISSSGNIEHKSQLYYAKVTSGAITIGGNSSQVGVPTITKYNTDGDNAGTNVNAIAFTGSASTTEPTSGNYVAVQVAIPAKTIAPTVTLGTAGWIGDTNQVTVNNVTSSARTLQVYIPLTSGQLSAGDGVANASSGNITLNAKTTTQPTSGKYITVTGSGTVSVGTGGYLAAGTSLSSNTATAYYPVPSLTASNFSATGGVIKSTSAGWLDANVQVANLGTGTLANSATSGQTYTTVTSPAIDTADGYLYINKGYFANTKISLATLIPDSATTDVVSTALLPNYEAFDTNGVRIVGGMTIYDGDYSSSGWSA